MGPGSLTVSGEDVGVAPPPDHVGPSRAGVYAQVKRMLRLVYADRKLAVPVTVLVSNKPDGCGATTLNVA